MRAAIYTRLSHDKTGAGLAVERQESDCRSLAADLGLEVVAVFCDNSISAFSGAHRPGYEALLTSVTKHEVEAVVVWHQDRLLRRNTDLEDYIGACEPNAVPTYTVKAGVLDLSTPAGRAVARTLAAWASYEIETSTARVRAAKLQSAKAGRWSGGRRPFGYEPGCTAIRESEAQYYREAVQRITSGQSFNTVAQDFNRRGIKTSTGSTWLGLKLSNLLRSKRYAAIRQHNGAEYPADWPAIITPEQFERLQAAIAHHRSQYKQHGPVRRNLLTGFVVCGNCQERMSSGQRKNGQRRYVCIHCHKVMRLVEPVDLLVTESLLYRLDTPDLAELLTKPNADKDDLQLKELLQERQARLTRLDELTDDYLAGLFTKSELSRAKTAGEAALHELDQQIDTITRARTGAVMLPVGVTVRDAWATADLAWRRQLIGLVIKRVVIKPSPGSAQMPNSERFHGWRFRPQDVSIEWLA